MFGRKKIEDAIIEPDPPVQNAPVGKGRPTPKRRDAEAANKRPLVSGDRKADRARARQKAAEQRRLMDEAMQTGDERHMPPQHKGPARRFARDFIDSRWTLGEAFLPIALLVVLVMFGGSALQLPPEIIIYSILALYVVVIVAVIEAIVLAGMVHRRAVAKYGRAKVRGIRLYAGMRSMQLRRMRLPKPQVKRGQRPS